MEDLTGKRFGRLVVVSKSFDKRNPKGTLEHFWSCKCDCGNVKNIRQSALVYAGTKSCGCICTEVHSTQNGLSGSRLYGIWRGMKKRCFSKSDPAYHNYGARGITVCEEWSKSFLSFYDWALSNGYDETLFIDRIDNDGCYCPDNCRWVSMRTQSNNRRVNHFVEYNGERHTLAEWEAITGISQVKIRRRLKDGWNAEAALTIKDGTKNRNDTNRRTPMKGEMK